MHTFAEPDAHRTQMLRPDLRVIEAKSNNQLLFFVYVQATNKNS